MRLLICLILIPTLAVGQTIIGPLTEGEFYSEVVYEGVYFSPGNCTWNDGMEYVFVVDAPDPDSTVLINGWLPVNVGDSTAITPTTMGLGISAASNPAQLNFHIRLIGTPTTAGQAHPCWIDQLQTLAICDNMWGLFNGETPIACTVQTSIGIEESDKPISVRMMDETITIDSPEKGELSILSSDGKLISKMSLMRGTTHVETPDYQGLLMILIRTSSTRFSKKILLQK